MRDLPRSSLRRPGALTETRAQNRLGSRIFFIAFGALLLSVAGSLGHLLQVPAVLPVRSDLLVVLGGGAGDRVWTALDLYGRGLASNVLVTGAQDTHIRDRFHSRDARLKLFRDSGAPPESLYVDGSARSTWAEAHAIRELMLREHWRDVLIVTDPPHALRVDWSIAHAFLGSSLKYRIIATQPTWWLPWAWWTDVTASAFVGKELIKNIYYRIHYG